MSPSPSLFGESDPYQFTDADQDKYSASHWRCPRRLVRSGEWAELWRGGGKVHAVLPLLAMHTWPGKEMCELARHRASLFKGGTDELRRIPPDGGTSWTPWACLTAREAASLCRVSTSTLHRVLGILEAEGLAQRHTEKRHPVNGGVLGFYRLNAAALFPEPGEPFTRISGALIYGGLWSLLPTHAARSLYVALAAFDPVYDEEALSASMYYGTDAVETEERIAEMRASVPLPVARLAKLTGQTEKTVKAARRILLAPSLPLFRSHESRVDGVWSYSLNPEYRELIIRPDFLNNRTESDRYARDVWGEDASATQCAEFRASLFATLGHVTRKENERKRAA